MPGGDKLKPINEAHILVEACPRCRVQTKMNGHIYYCAEHDLGNFDKPCQQSDWRICPFNPVITRGKVGDG